MDPRRAGGAEQKTERGCDPADDGPGADAGVLRIAAHQFRRAPRRLQVMLVVATVYMLAAMVFVLLRDGWQGWRDAETWIALGGAFSGLVVGAAYGMFAVAQGTECNWKRMRLVTRRLHPMVLALPVFVFAGGVLAAAAFAGLLATQRDFSSIMFWITALTFVLVLWVAVMGLRDSTRFLYEHAKQQAELAAQARAEATVAQLSALQAQLNPHFLFNALNTVASLVRTDPRAAEATVENLARILRRTLDRSRQHSIPLADELDYVRAYLSIEQARFGDRLKIDWDVDPSMTAQRVPPMTLQPLVENSLKHGLAVRLSGGRIRIAASRENGTLHLEVGDDGPGFAPAYTEGTGLGNLRRRLETLYGADAQLRIVRDRAGALVAVDLPANRE